MSSTRGKKSAEKVAKNKRPQSPQDYPAKRPKADLSINYPPTQKLDVYVFGGGNAGELGLGPTPIDGRYPTNVKVPRQNALLDAFGIVQIAVGGMHCVALGRDNQIVTWGVNDEGALGRDTTKESGSGADHWSDLDPKESTPTVIFQDGSGTSHVFAQVAVADSASFALTTTGLFFGWGTFRAINGPLGFRANDALLAEQTKDPLKKFQLQPVLVSSLTKIKFLAAGSNHVLALDNKGRVYSWGNGEQSQLGRRMLGRNRPYESLSPGRIALYNVKQIACGSSHSFAITNDGLVYAWGLNNFGQTGIPNNAGEDNANIQQPTIVENLRAYKIQEIQGGAHHSIACTEDGVVLVWGRCDFSQMGVNLENVPKEEILFDARGRARILLKPTAVPGINAVFVDAAIDNSFAITNDGKAYAWGYSDNFRTGLGTEEVVTEPTLIQRGDIKDKFLTFVGCGGQYSILAGPAEN